jgi:hypothetical protein
MDTPASAATSRMVTRLICYSSVLAAPGRMLAGEHPDTARRPCLATGSGRTPRGVAASPPLR